MKSTSSHLKVALASMLGIVASPFRHLPDRRYGIEPTKYANGQIRNPAGSKLARMAAEKRLTGNRMSHYGRGLLNQFAAKRTTRGSLV